MAISLVETAKTRKSTRSRTLGLRAGEWVQVKTKEEILRTLDSDGRLDELPFMPEMFEYCGRILRVGKRAHKTCDPALGIGGRRMVNTIHLENIRCSGASHDGCEAACLIFWKEEWLKRAGADGRTEDEEMSLHESKPARTPRCTEEDVAAAIRVNTTGDSEPIYVCQNTQLKFATEPVQWWNLQQYVEDYTSGNVRISQMLAAFAFFIWQSVAEAGIGLGTAMRWIYDRFQGLIDGAPYPLRPCEVAKGTPTPTERLNLQSGELIRVKSYPEILKTLDVNWRNRGMYFDSEMVPFTGREYKVKRRVKQIIDEKTGKMIRFKTDAIMLENVLCEARYAKCRRFCPRAIYPYWREIWLERTSSGSGDAQ